MVVLYWRKFFRIASSLFSTCTRICDCSSDRTRLVILVLSMGLTACATSCPPPHAAPAPSTSGGGHALARGGAQVTGPAAMPTEEPEFTWPARGKIVGRFDGKSNRGIDIAGQYGDAVVAARDGKVVLVSNALASYGNMVVLMHDETLLTAYALLDRTLVKEGEVVRKGQRIADMGHRATGDAALHFEVRKQGVPVDPLPYLLGHAN
ncbi:Murein hydrolase activator NlpD precursor [compost metagenome]